MRTFYIFKINKRFNTIYEKKTINIYKILDKINRFDKKDYLFAKRIYSKLIDPLDKYRLDNYILMNHVNDIYYTKNNNIHELKSPKEKSTLIINNTYIKIKTTNNISSFFKDISTLNNSLFVVDFKNKDYFYLEDFNVNVLAR